ncbi:MAG TPA: glycosyltransferase [Candidatus Norongarragalinales archaeon]|nr:glycosyltransferase [Candidatus Norongarragalinales archaeon]
MQIAWLSDTFEQNNGVATYLQETLPMLSKKADVTLFTGRVSKKYDFKTVSLGSLKDPFLPTYDVIIPPVKPIKCDIVHAHSQYSLGVFASKFKVPKVITAHFIPLHTLESMFGSSPPKVLEDGIWKYEIWLLNQFDRVVTQTEAGKEMFVKRGLKRKVEVIANGINLENYKGANGERFRKKYSLSKPFALFIGRLDASKQPQWIIEIARQLKDMQFIISGNGTMEAQLKSMAPKNVIFYPRFTRQDLLDAYAACSTLMMPSLTETEGLVAQEAMACGAPVLISDLDILREVVGKGGFACKNSSEMGEKLSEISNNPKMQREMSERAMEEIKKRDINLSIEKLVKLYESLI